MQSDVTKKEKDSSYSMNYTKKVMHLVVVGNVYEQSITFDADCGKVFYFVDNLNESVSLFSNFLDSPNKCDRVFTIEGQYLCSEVEEETGVLVYRNEKIFLDTFMEGVCNSSIELEPTVFERGFPSKMVSGSSENYILMSAETVISIDKNTGVTSVLECPGKNFLGCFKLEDGNIVVTYLDDNMNRNLAILDVEKGELRDANTIPTSGLFVCDDNGTILLTDGGEVYSFDRLTKETCQIFDLSKKAVKKDWFAGIRKKGEKFYIASFHRENNDEKLDIMVLSPTTEDTNFAGGEYDEDGRRIVYMVSDVGASYAKKMLDTEIQNFNYESPDYCIEVIDKDLDIKGDLLFSLSYQTQEKYVRNGYLCDLWPFFKMSSCINVDDIDPLVVKMFERDGRLFSISESIIPRTIMIKESDALDATTWTTDEFLEWIAKNSEKNVRTTRAEGLSRETILEYCLLGNLDLYVDKDNMTADFCTPDFENMLVKIKNIQLSDESSNPIELYLFLEDGYDKYPLLVENVTSPDRWGLYETELSEKLVTLGYPNDSGKQVNILSCGATFSILQNSECPEGAFAFIEYILLKDKDSLFEEAPEEYKCGEKPEGILYTLLSIREKSFEKAIGDHVRGTLESETKYYVSSEHCEGMEELLNNATVDMYIDKCVRDIIEEEFQQFLCSDTDISTTCNVINNRVAILLSEYK